MKLLRVGEVGRERPAVLIDERTAWDVSGVVDDFDGGFFAGDGPDRLRERVAAGDLPVVELATVRVGAPIARPGSVIAIGLNYATHAAEAGEVKPPAEPVVFSKPPNTVVGPYDDVLIPPGSVKTDYEVELGVVVGRTCRYLDSPDRALEHVAGYCVSNDVSERAYQLERGGGQWTKGKSSETFNPLGPWLVTPDEVGDPGVLDLWLTLNGERMQHDNTTSLIFDVPYLLWYLSQFMVLEPGDLVNTGTPAGVGMGRSPQRFLVDGDVLELSVQGLGQQRSRCVPAVR
jgi:2-keto-4-pentenoate hydratase/2-oxohepta-3-ene-1,7-dioic acid hydratase in catechol pathway